MGLGFSVYLLDQHSSGLLPITVGSVLLWTSPINFCWISTPLGFSVYLLDQHSSGLLLINVGSVLLWTSPFNCLDQHSSGLLRITAGSVLLWTSPYNCWISAPLDFSVYLLLTSLHNGFRVEVKF